MADVDLNVRFVRRSQPVLQLVGKHHLSQFALRVGFVRVVVLVPVHVVELDGLEPHIVAKASHDYDAALAFLDSLEQQPAKQEMPIMVRAQHAFKTIYGGF